MVSYELWIGGTKREYVNLKIIWSVDYNILPTWQANLNYANEAVNKGDTVEIKRQNSQDVSMVSIFKGVMEYKKPKMLNTGQRVMVAGGRHVGMKLWRKWNERNSDNMGFWTDYYPHKVIEFLTRPTRSPKPSVVEDKLYRRIGWGLDPRDIASMWKYDASSTGSGTKPTNLGDRYNTIGWKSSVNNQNGQWAEIDLGSTKNVMGIRIENRTGPDEHYWLRGYQIKTSTTGVFGGEEITVATQAENHARNIVESWTPANTRYIRIYGTVTTTFPVYIGDIYVYDSSGAISGISAGTLTQYLPLNCSEITENAGSGQTYVKVRHSHRFVENDYIRIFSGTGSEVTKKITSITGATHTLNFAAGIGFAIDIVNSPHVANLEHTHSHQINLDYMRRTEAINKIVKLCIAADNEAWDWWVDDDGVADFAEKRGTDVSGSVSFDYASEIEDSEHVQDDRKAIDSVLVLPRKGTDPDAQDINSSGWQGTGDYEEVIFDSEIETEQAAISKALAIIEQAVKDVDNIITTVDDDEVATGSWGIGDTVAINDTATGYSGDYRVLKVMRVYDESGETVTIEANSKRYTLTDLIYGISKDVRAGAMQQVYEEQWKRLGVTTSKPEYILFYEAELLTFDPATTDKTIDENTSGGAYIKRTSAKATADMMWGPGLTLNAGLYRVRFWCKVLNNASSSTVATLKIYSADGGYTEPLDIAPDDFTSSDTWQGFTFLFALENEFTDIQIIISFITGITDFSCDWAAIMVGGTDTLADIDLDFPAGAPATPTGLTATSKPLGGLLEWTMNTEQDLSHYEIYKHTSNDSGSASRIAEVMGNWFFYTCDSGEYGLTRYFWVKAVDWVGQASGFSTVSSCTMGQIGGLDIALLAVDTEHLQNYAVEGAKIASGSVSGVKIALNTITANKIKSGAQNFNSNIIYVPKSGDEHDQVTYSSGTITFVDGGTISITGSDLNFSSGNGYGIGWWYISATVGSSSLSEESSEDFLSDTKIIVGAVKVSSDSGQQIAIFPIGSQGWNIIADNIAADAITTPKLDAGAVTAQKMTIYSVLLDNPNFHIDTGALAWDQHELTYEGDIYTIASGSTNYEWVVWDEGDSFFSVDDERPDMATDQTLHPIAVFDDANDRWWEVWKPTVVHGGMLVAETISAEVLETDFFLSEVEMKTGITAQWDDTVGGAGVIITKYGIRGKDASGNIQWEALNTGAEAGRIVAAGGNIVLDSTSLRCYGQSIGLYNATPAYRGYISAILSPEDEVRFHSLTQMEILADTYLELKTTNNDIILSAAIGGADVRVRANSLQPYYDSNFDLGTDSIRWENIYGDKLFGDLHLTEYVSKPSILSEHHRRVIYVRADADEKTYIYICVQNDANNWEWVQIGVST